MTWLIATLVIGLAGGTLLHKLKFPAGAMVGAMLFVAVFSVATGKAEMPANLRVLTQIVAGAFIGAAIQYKDLLALKKILLPAFVMIFLMISLDLVMGYIMYRTTDLDLATALMACAPGGVMDISLIAADVGANSSKVAILQLLRLMTVMSFFPLMLKKISRQTSRSAALETGGDQLAVTGEQLDRIKNQWYLSRRVNENVFYTLFIALLTGILGYSLGVPAGGLTFAMIGTASWNVLTGRGYMPLILRLLTQMLAGTLIGVRMTYQDLSALGEVMIPALLLITGLIIINLIVGYLLNKITNIGLITSLISSVPGGVSDMALIAAELGGDQSKVAVLQLFRYVFVIGLYPLLIRFLIGIMR